MPQRTCPVSPTNRPWPARAAATITSPITSYRARRGTKAPVISDARVRRIWDGYAPRYDRDMRLWERLLFAGGREWVCSQAIGNVLEVAIGTGLNLPHYPPDVALTGIDLSPEMLAIARTRAADLGRAVTLHQADAHALPFPDRSFDTVTCTLSLCSIPDDRAAIAEMHRVLRSGGQLLLLDHVAAPNPLLRTGQRLFEAITVRLAADYQTRRPLPLLQQAGFTITHNERSKAGTVERLRAIRPLQPMPAEPS
jgi:ubiquinone/menaquinone biosynthesis C-methylase UbiE